MLGGWRPGVRRMPSRTRFHCTTWFTPAAAGADSEARAPPTATASAARTRASAPARSGRRMRSSVVIEVSLSGRDLSARRLDGVEQRLGSADRLARVAEREGGDARGGAGAPDSADAVERAEH